MIERVARTDTRSDLRRAGQVVRWHTWPSIRRECNAEHQWQVTRILVTIWPDSRAEAIILALHHDSGELLSGDMPYGGKTETPGIRAALNEVEEIGRRRCGAPAPVVTTQEARRVKYCDLLDGWEYGMDEAMMGNQFGKIVHDRIREALDAMLDSWQPDDKLVLEYMRRRIEIYEDTMAGRST